MQDIDYQQRKREELGFNLDATPIFTREQSWVLCNVRDFNVRPWVGLAQSNPSSTHLISPTPLSGKALQPALSKSRGRARM
jgi:hypothetical protein